MKNLAKLLFNKNFLPILVVLFFGILASRTLLFGEGYFNMHDDLQMMRQLQMEKCFADLQIPCRWVPDMGYGFGFPLFNFYPPLPYLIGQIIREVGFTFVDTAKITFALSIIISGVTMYFLASTFFGRLGGILASVFYVWAPYHAVDVYVRGAMNEAWALAWFPLIFWTSYKIITRKSSLDWRKLKSVKIFGYLQDVFGNDYGWIVGFVLSYAALLLTHNLMILIFTPVLGVWIVIHSVKSRNWISFLTLAISGVWAFGVGAYFTFPAIFENKFTQVKSQLIGYYDYTAHFVSIRQLLTSRFWGYGPSVWMEADDRMSFQVGHFHWILSLIIGVIIIAKTIRILQTNRNISSYINHPYLLIVSFMLIVGWLSAFMTHPKSIFIWKLLPPLGYVQFPWRFLTLVIFSFSFLVAIIPRLLKTNKRFIDFAFAPTRVLIVSIMCLSVVVFNWNYFLPEHGKLGPLTDEQKFTKAAWDLQQTAGIYDYLPSTAKTAPKEPMKNLIEFMDGEGTFSEDYFLKTNFASSSVNVISDSAILRLGIFQFPGWKTYVDGQEVQNYVDSTEEWGRMYIEVPTGEHQISARFTDTPVRKYSNFVSLVSVTFLILYLWWAKRVTKANE